MKIGIVGPIPSELKFLIESAMKAGAKVEVISGEEAKEMGPQIKSPFRGIGIPVATAEPEQPLSAEINVSREVAAKDEVVASILAPLMGKSIRHHIPYGGKIDLSKYSDRDIMAAVFAMGRLLDGPEAKQFVDALENGGHSLAVDFFIELDRKYGEIEGGFEVGEFPELADALFEIFLEFKKENAKISFDFALVENE